MLVCCVVSAVMDSGGAVSCLLSCVASTVSAVMDSGSGRILF